MVAMSIFLVVIGGVLASHLFGLRMIEITKIKLAVSDSIPRGIEEMRSEVQSAKIVLIGLGNSDTFTPALDNAPQVGNAIQIYRTSDTNVFIRYYLDTKDKALKRLGTNAAVTVVAEIIGNTTIFAAEDFKGNTLTNKDDRSLIGVNMAISELKSSDIKFGPGNHYTHYPMRTKIARRTGE